MPPTSAKTEREKRRDQQAPRVPGQVYTQLTLGDRRRYMREVRGIGQTELARRCGLTPAAVSNWVTDTTRKPNAPSILTLAAALDADPEWILTGIGNPEASPGPQTAAEKELLQLYRRCARAGQEAILATARAVSPKA